MSKKIDISGLKFGKLLVIEEASKRTNKGVLLWRCLCDCGNETTATGSSLKQGNTASCGCFKVLYGVKYTPQEATARRAMKNYSINNRLFKLSFEEFFKRSQFNCFYCGKEPSNLTKSENISEWSKLNGDFIYNGLDRVDSSKDYTIDNVVTCCKYCNKSKCALTICDFKSHIKNLLNIRESNFDNNFLNIKSTLIENISIPLNRPENYLDKHPGDIVPGIIIGKWTILSEVSGEKYSPKKYLCQCECGTIKEVNAVSIKRGISRSCGNPFCFQEFSSEIYKARKIWISRYKDEDLSFEDFYFISQLNCVYCGVEPRQIITAKNNKQFIYNGLDRINSSIGHFKNNVVPCCYDCNKMKNDRSLYEFDQWLTNINNNWIIPNKTIEGYQNAS